MRTISAKFDAASTDLYKQLQRPAVVDLADVIELEADGAVAFAGVMIALFGTDAEDLRELGSIGRTLHVSLLDRDSGIAYLYPATILHSGLLPSGDLVAERAPAKRIAWKYTVSR